MSQFQQNRFSGNNEGRFYKKIDGSEQGEDTLTHDAQEAKTFWIDIWGQQVEHNKDTTWLREIKKDTNGKNKQTRLQISQEKLKKILKKIPNCKTPGPDGVQGFWLKNFTSLHKNLVWHFLVWKLSKQLWPHYISPLDMETVDKDNCWWNLWFSRERRDINRGPEMMQKEVKEYWRSVIHR